VDETGDEGKNNIGEREREREKERERERTPFFSTVAI